MRATASARVDGSFEDVFAAFDPGRADFLRRLVASGKTGRSWTSLDPDAAAAALGEERSRIVAALGHLEERQLIELRAADARQRYTVLARPASAGRAARPTRRAVRAPRAGRDGADRARRLARHPRRLSGQRARRLLRRGARRAVRPLHVLPHRARAAASARRGVPPPLDEVVDRHALAALAAAHPEALGAPRQRARFLCGITSPATSRAKLTRDEALREPRRPPLRGGARMVRE